MGKWNPLSLSSAASKKAGVSPSPARDARHPLPQGARAVLYLFYLIPGYRSLSKRNDAHRDEAPGEPRRRSPRLPENRIDGLPRASHARSAAHSHRHYRKPRPAGPGGIRRSAQRSRGHSGFQALQAGEPRSEERGLADPDQTPGG